MTLSILQFVPEPLPTYRADVAVLFGKYLPTQGVDCHIVGAASKAPPADQGFASTLRPQYHPNRLHREFRYLKQCLQQLLKARRAHCHAIQVRDMVSIGLLSLVIARMKGIPFFYWVSYLMSEGRIGNARAELARRKSLRNRAVLWKGLLERWLLYKVVLPSADHVFVQSDRMLEVMAERGLRREAMTAVPMGVDTELMAEAPVPCRLDGWDGVPTIAYLGSLERARQLETVIDALALVRREIPTARLLFIGGSPNPTDEKMLLEHARNVGQIDAVHITGWLPAAQARSLLVAADLAISYIPRGDLYDVSSPTKLLEYLALSMPAVGNDTPDQEYVLRRSNAGWLTESNAPAMAAAMQEILMDPVAARQRAERGPTFIDAKRSYRELARMLGQRYRELLPGRK